MVDIFPHRGFLNSVLEFAYSWNFVILESKSEVKSNPCFGKILDTLQSIPQDRELLSNITH